MNTKKKRCGYITIIGKSNVGKSTLINNIINKEISIVSNKKNTTQSNILGIKTEKLNQCIYIDTPGIKINRNINTQNLTNEYKKLNYSTLIIFMVDRTIWKKDDEIILKNIQKINIPIIFIINKIDKISNKKILLPYIHFIMKTFHIKEILPISAKIKKYIILLEKIIYSYLPKKNHIFPKYYNTTNTLCFSISEIIRKQVIFFLRDELPFTTKVNIESITTDKKNILHIKSIIYVKCIRQKKIIIGRHGTMIKKISTLARYNIEKIFHLKTYLLTWVKIIIK